MIIRQGFKIFLTIIFCFISLNCYEEEYIAVDNRLLNYVNPMIGTGGTGSSTFDLGATFPGASAPFGMVKLSPDTTINGVHSVLTHFSGYIYQDTQIRGFSHTHLSGAGVTDYGNLSIMPLPTWENGYALERNRYASFSHTSEITSPGYYSVILEESNIQAELTARLNTGVHRYTFPVGSQPYISIHATASIFEFFALDGEIQINPNQNEVYGWVKQKGSFSFTYDGYTLYFYIKSRESFTDYGVWEGMTVYPNQLSAENRPCGAYLGYPEGTKQVQLAVGISFISMDQAKLNAQMEIENLEHATWDFDNVLTITQKEWRDNLSLIQVYGGSYQETIIFYTALYHSFLHPTYFTEAMGKYKGFDGAVHTTSGFNYYSDFSLWDTYRTLHPLLALIQPERQKDMVRSLLKMSEQGGYLPKWPFATGYTNVMVGTSADIVIADTYLKGITDFDANLALNKMKLTALNPTPGDHVYFGRTDIEHFQNYGYIPQEIEDQSVSVTMEYCYNDFAVAQLAQALGYQSDADLFYQRSKNYQNLWNEEIQAFIPKNASGEWYNNVEDDVLTPGYTEGNYRHYRFFVPYQTEQLISLFENGSDGMNAQLQDFFENSTVNPTLSTSSNRTAADPYYWHGNEPDIHCAYLFNYTGRPDLTQYWVREIMLNKYANTPDGLPGNDDLGTLSAWYVFSAIGLYPIAATDQYLIGSPIFKHISLKLKNGTFTIVADRTSHSRRYIQSARLNGETLNSPIIKHSDIRAGGSLVLEMGSSPSSWGISQ